MIGTYEEVNNGNSRNMNVYLRRVRFFFKVNVEKSFAMCGLVPKVHGEIKLFRDTKYYENIINFRAFQVREGSLPQNSSARQ